MRKKRQRVWIPALVGMTKHRAIPPCPSTFFAAEMAEGTAGRAISAHALSRIQRIESAARP